MLIVQKFGGSSVANAERVFNVAGIVTDTYRQGNDVVVVVSAQGHHRRSDRKGQGNQPLRQQAGDGYAPRRRRADQRGPAGHGD